MLFRNIIISTALFGVATASVLPRSAPETSSLSANLETRSPAPGYGIGSTATTALQVDAGLRLFTNTQLSYASAISDIFLNIESSTEIDLDATVNAVLGIGINLFAWDSTDLSTLSSALGLYIGGSLTTDVAIFTQAKFSISSFSVIEAQCLQTFISTCVDSDFGLTVAVRSDITLFVHTAIWTAQYGCSNFYAKVNTCSSDLLAVVTALHLDSTSSTCVSAAAALKLSLRAYVNSCISASSGLLQVLIKLTLSSLLLIVNAWVAGNFSTLTGTVAGLLGINLSACSDVQICVAIVGFLQSCSQKFNFSSYLGLDLDVYSSIFSAVTA